MGQERRQRHLPHHRRLPCHVRTGDDEELPSVGVEGYIVRDEALAARHQALEDWMPARLEL